MTIPTRWPINALIFGGASVWGLLLISCVMTSGTMVTPPLIAGAAFVGSSGCAECHENVTSQFHDITHNNLIASGTKAKGPELGCESCHGPASLHVKSGGEDGTIVNNATLCVGCHYNFFRRATGGIDYLFSPNQVPGGTDPSYYPPGSTNTNSGYVAQFNDDSNRSIYHVDRFTYGMGFRAVRRGHVSPCIQKQRHGSALLGT